MGRLLVEVFLFGIIRVIESPLRQPFTATVDKCPEILAAGAPSTV
jgi:hypothetical protein